MVVFKLLVISLGKSHYFTGGFSLEMYSAAEIIFLLILYELNFGFDPVKEYFLEVASWLKDENFFYC